MFATIVPSVSLWSAQQSASLRIGYLSNLTSLIPPPTHSLTIQVDVLVACLLHAIAGHCISNAHDLLAGAVVWPTPANEGRVTLSKRQHGDTIITHFPRVHQVFQHIGGVIPAHGY